MALIVGEFLGVPLGVVESMPVSELSLWLAYIAEKNKEASKSSSKRGGGKSERRRFR